MTEQPKHNSINRWLLEVTGPAVVPITAVAFLKAVNGATGALYALLMKQVIDSAQAGVMSVFVSQLARIAGLALFQLLLSLLLSVCGGLAYFAVEQRFKERLFSQILRRDYAAVSAVHSGDWQTRLTGDTGIVADAVVKIVPNLIGRLVKLASVIAVLVYLDPVLAAILIPSCMLVFLVTLVFRKSLKEKHRRVQEADSSYRVFLQEQLAGLIVTRAYGTEEQSVREERGHIAAHREARLKRMYFSSACKTGYAAAVKAMTFLTLAYCCYGILKGSVTAGSLTALLQLAGQVRAPFADISGLVPKYMSMTASAERLREIEQVTEDAAGLGQAALRGIYDREMTGLGMTGVGFSYRTKESTPVLSDFSFAVEKGSIVAFTGPSGCGKSTVLKLLLALYRPDCGRIYMRLSNGEEAELDAVHRRLFAYVPQQSILRKGTIRDAVAFAEPEASGDDARICRALELACAREFVDALENGIDTELGERGAGLSEGQLQRLAIARAVFSDRPVLLLDESTSALDEETEKRLLANLRSMKAYTVIIVTHRAAVLSICDRVLHFSPEGIEERK